MKVTANEIPSQFHLEAYDPCPGMAELRLRENVKPVNGMYVYDEYILKLPDRPGLAEAVQRDLESWLATARALEVGEDSSLVTDLRSALELVVPGQNRGMELEAAQEFNRELQQALQLVFDTLNQGQQQKLWKEPKVAALFQRCQVGGGQ